MGKIYEAKMKTEFDEICGNSSNEMVDLSYTDLARHIKDKISTCSAEEIEKIKVELQRRKVHANTISKMFISIFIPFEVMFLSPFFTDKSDLAQTVAFFLVCAIVVVLCIVLGHNSQTEERCCELLDLIEKNDPNRNS